MSASPVSYETQGNVAVLRLDDGKANVFSPAMIAALQAALNRAESEAAAVVVLGREKRLSAGFDMSIMSGGVDTMRQLVIDGANLFLRIYEFPLPVVVGCTGHALAAGAILLLCADYRVGAEGEFKIGLNEVAIQMTLPTFGVEVARDRLDKRHFTQAITQARIYSPSGACDAGYLDETVAAMDLAARAIEHGQRLATLPQAAFHGTKLRERGATLALIRRNLVEEITELAIG